MPRGVKGSGKARGRLTRQPASLQQQPGQPAQAAAAAQPFTPPAVVLEDDRKPLGSVDIDSLAGDALKRYARRAGVLPRDVEGLSEDRLRQNTKLVIANHFDLITE